MIFKGTTTTFQKHLIVNVFSSHRRALGTALSQEEEEKEEEEQQH